jgi:DNA polymerase-4
MRRYGAEGARLWRLSRGVDDRAVRADRDTKSVSAETTFERDLAGFRALELKLWQLSERVSARLKAQELAGRTVTLKLKTADFRSRTRAQSLPQPTQLAASIFAAGRDLLALEADGTPYRLIGIGVSALAGADQVEAEDLLDRRTEQAERAIDRLRARFGDEAIIKGRALEGEE